MPADPPFTTRPQLTGTFGMVASTHWLASAAGMAVLEKGGNAFDAAVATGLVLQVVEPHQNGLGGEAPMIGYDVTGGEVFVLDGQGTAPAAATPEAFAALGVGLIPGTGLLAACVPAAFGAWMLLLAKYGSLPPAQVMEYAIGYAEHGYPMTVSGGQTIAAVAGTFREHWPTSAQIYLAGGPPAAGARFANPVLAGVYRRLLAEAQAAGSDRQAQIEAARRAFYQGFVAEAIAGFVAGPAVMDVTGRPHSGLLSGDDLAAWRSSAEQPVSLTCHGLTVCKTGPWGQGPVMLQQLALLDGLGLEQLDPDGADYIHLVTESAKLAFADREAWYGDPRQVSVPMQALLSARYADARRALIGERASAELRPGAPDGAAPVLPDFALAAFPAAAGTGGSGRAGDPVLAAGQAGTGDPTLGGTAGPAGSAGSGRPARPAELGPGDTCHLDVADRFGNMISVTPSGGWLQSSPVIPGLGFCLGTRAQMFSLSPGLPNTLAPGKRPRTTLSPGLALRDGEPCLAFGTPGGDQQDQWPLAVLLRHLLFGQDLQQAIDAPAWHTSHFPSSFYPRGSEPGSLYIEARAGAEVIGRLRGRGHQVTVMPDWSLGRVTAVARRGGFLCAAANARGMQGYAAGR